MKHFLDSVATKYASSPIAQILANFATNAITINPSLMPLVITIVDIMATHRSSEIENKRLLETLKTIFLNLEKIEISTLKKDFLESEEFYDLCSSMLTKSIKTRHNEKRLLYVKILKGVIENPITLLKAEDYLEVISELSQTELQVANLVFKYQGAYAQEKADQSIRFSGREGWNLVENYCKENQIDSTFVLERIARTGLIKEVSGMVRYSDPQYKITQTFEDLMNFINQQ